MGVAVAVKVQVGVDVKVGVVEQGVPWAFRQAVEVEVSVGVKVAVGGMVGDVGWPLLAQAVGINPNAAASRIKTKTQ